MYSVLDRSYNEKMLTVSRLDVTMIDFTGVRPVLAFVVWLLDSDSFLGIVAVN